MLRRTVALGASLLLLGACSGENPDIDPTSETDNRTEEAVAEPSAGGPDAAAPASDDRAIASNRGPVAADPREGGFEIALGEWAVTPEADAIRPGRVTFLIHNRGTMPHGFEIELEGESSGSGSGDLFKAESELLQPGESTRMTVELTLTGVYKIECLVDGHDDMGMEGPLEVRADAPLVSAKPKQDTSVSGGSKIAITNFEFDPSALEVAAGTKVTWTNDDPAPHTVTSLEGPFDSGTLGSGDAYSFRFDEPGTYDYRCNVHPDMKGTVKVR